MTVLVQDVRGLVADAAQIAQSATENHCGLTMNETQRVRELLVEALDRIDEDQRAAKLYHHAMQDLRAKLKVNVS